MEYFYESDYELPKLNHHLNVGEENIGWTWGVMANGVPFEAELWVKNGEVNISVFLPEIILKVEYEDPDQTSHDVTILPGKLKEGCGILKVGLMDRGYVTDYDTVITYVDFLEEYELIEFYGGERNGKIHRFCDKEGNETVEVMVALNTEEGFIGETPLVFRPFGTKSDHFVMYKKLYI